MLLHHAQKVQQQQGLAALLRLLNKHLKRKLGRYSPGHFDFGYQEWIKKTKLKPSPPSPSSTPDISILVPVYNVKERWLREMVASVQAQTYQHWELCMVNDCATDTHVATVLNECAKADPRIRVAHNGSNLGIAETSNAALKLASGSFIVLLDHDDLLISHALERLVLATEHHPESNLFYSDEDKLDASGNRVSPFFKPDFSPALLRSQNYFGHLVMLSRGLIDQIGGFQSGFNGAQDYDLVLRASEQATQITHVPEVLYHWRQIPGSTAAIYTEKDYAWEAGQRALQAHLDRTKVQASAEKGDLPGTYLIKHTLIDQPFVSIVIPFRNEIVLLEKCFHGLLNNTRWQRFEIIAVDNQSNMAEVDALKQRWVTDPRIRFVTFDKPFNFSAICNHGVAQSKGKYVVLMNNDVEIRSKDWLESLLGYAQQPETGAVGAKLLYPDRSIQHMGIVIGIGECAGHPFKRFPESENGYFGRLKITSNVSAVTAALLMVDKQKYLGVGGFDEKAFSIALNDVDFCLKLREAGYLNVVTPAVYAFHYESKSRGTDTSSKNLERYAGELKAFQSKWSDTLNDCDPYYNPNLTTHSEDYRLRGL